MIPVMPSAWGSQGKREKKDRLSGTWKKDRVCVCALTYNRVFAAKVGVYSHVSCHDKVGICSLHL